MKKQITITKEGDEIWFVDCEKCGKKMEACDGFSPVLCAGCVFENLNTLKK